MSKLTSTIIGVYFAVTVVFSFTVILSPTAFFSVPTIQPSNTWFSGGVNSLPSGNVYSLPLATDTFSLLPLPSPLSKLTSTIIGFHVAVSVTSPEISIFSPTSFNSVLSPTFQPANSLSFSGVNVGFGSGYLLPLLTVTSSIEPVAPASVWNVTLDSICLHDAFITVSFVIVISVPGSVVVVASPTNHPSNSWFAGGVKVFLAGRVKFSPLFLYSTLSSPVPPFA